MGVYLAWKTKSGIPIGEDHLRLIDLRRRTGTTSGPWLTYRNEPLTNHRALHMLLRPRLLTLQALGIGVPSELDIRTVGLRTFRRGGTTDAKDCNVQPEAVDIHCRWRDRGVSTQDIYDARSIKRRVRVSEAMLA